MTLSLPFRFNHAARRALYLSGHQLTVYESRDGRLTNAYLFQYGEEGLADFSAYLREVPWLPTYFLLDMMEEEYRRDNVPHVIGRDRSDLFRNRAGRLFRDAPYWTVRVQGRERVGRRDDRVLFAAITNASLIAPWLQRLQENKVPLAGIYSLPLLTERLVPMVCGDRPHCLVMSLQSTGNLRQSFFEGGHLKISRLAHMPARDPAQLRDAMLEEAEKLRRYLNSLRLLGRDEPVNVYLLVHGPVLDALEPHCRESDMLRCRLLDLAYVAEHLEMNPAFVSPYADAVFAHLLLGSPPENHYGSARDTRYNTLRKARIGMYAASVVIGLGAVFGGGLHVVDGLILNQRGAATRLQADYYQARYQEARKGLPEIPAEPEELQRAVEMVAKLVENRIGPLGALERLSLGLDEYPALQVDRIEWGLGEGKSDEPMDAKRKTYLDLFGGGDLAATDSSVQHAMLEGRVEPFDGDYREALDMLRGFAEALRSYEGIKQVKLVSLPLNLSPSQQLRGDALTRMPHGDASFKIKVTFGKQDGQA